MKLLKHAEFVSGSKFSTIIRMECQEAPAAVAQDVINSSAKKKPKEKCYDLKYLKKKLPIYINLTKTGDSSDIKRGLIGIKTVLVSKSNSEHIFSVLQGCGGLRHLIRLISASNDQRQLGVVLCILHLAWNKIEQTSIRSEMLSWGVMCQLADVLVKPCEAGNQSRVLRFVSSICQSRVTERELQSSGISQAIVRLLTQTTDPAIQLTAIKTLRKMWSIEKNHGKMLECGAVKAVASFLDTKDPTLLSCVLKTIVIFTNPCTIYAAQQVVGKGDGYQLIVGMVGRPVVSELICNLSRSPVGKIELTRAGLVPEIIRQITSSKYDKYLIMALCQMCQESMVRASLRLTPHGFETFLSLITNRAADQYHSDLLYALTYFIYDTQSLTMMVRAGLVDVLVEKLSDVAKSLGSLHQECPPEPEPHYSPTSPVYSPSSPICSYYSTFEPCANFQDGRLLTPPDTGSGSKKKRKENESSCSKSQDSCILEVLLQLTYHHTKLKTLALRDTIDTILLYMTTLDLSRQESNFLRATKTLRAIVSCKHHFNKLLDDKGIMSIHRELCVRRHWNCKYCDRLYHSGQTILIEMAESSESALGEGEMAHRLTSGTGSMKTTVALTIPLIIKHPKLLTSLLLMHRGLDCLIKSLDSHIDDAVPALYSLMKTIGILNPQQTTAALEVSEGGPAQDSPSCDTPEGEDVEFELDDGSSISACRERLSRNYPMFEAMFRGGFLEASAPRVRLPGVSSHCFKALVSLDTPAPHPSLLPSSVSILLEMVSTSDRFLSPDLARNLISHIVHRVLSFETSPEIYSWSVNTGYKLPCSVSMAVTTISYLFTANMFLKDRVQAVQSIIDSPERHHLLTDLNSILLSGIHSYADRHHSRPFWTSPQLLLHTLF